MLENDEQLNIAREQIERIQDLLLEMRRRVSSNEYQEMARGFLADLKRREAEIYEYLSRVPELAA